MNPLFGIIYPDVPVYFGVNGHRYKLEGFFMDEYGRGPDPFAPPNCYELWDEDTGMYLLFTGKNAEKELFNYPLAGGATIGKDMATFDYLRIGEHPTENT